MSRTPLAILLGLIGFTAYVVGVVTLADRVLGMPWPVQALYYAVAGVLWVLPARALIVWAVRG